MAAGAGGSGGSMESKLDRKFQNVSNTMDSIQGLSTWCIDNKKYHSLIVRHWMKWMRKSDASHRLNLFYVANDVIQNSKRKNAMVYRTAFAEVLCDAFLLVNRDGDSKVMKSVERILSIWEDRGVYSGTLITELRSYLVKEESPPETPVEQKTPVDSKAALQSKVVAEFVPQALIDQLSKYKHSVEEADLREKQLAAMRVDVCSSDALKKLKDKAGGKRFSKDFEEGSAKLQDFVKFIERQSKGGPLLLEALSNADIFYEMQYQEVKIVANAYQTFANRVSNLKRKLDSQKATLPDLDESPIPSPSADAPSPTGSESPFHGLGTSNPDPDLDGSPMDDEAEPPAPSPLSSPGGSPKHTFNVGENDNREVEDMELSEDEAESVGIIVEDHVESPTPIAVSSPVPAKIQPSVATKLPITQATPTLAAPPASLDSVDLSKISSLLNSLTSVIKNTGPCVESPSAPTTTGSSVKTASPAPVASQDASSMVNLLSQVDMTPAELLSALSKTQGQGSSLQGLTSLLSSPVKKVSSDSSSTDKIPHSLPSTSASSAPFKNLPLSSVTPVPSPPISTVRQSPCPQTETLLPTPNSASALVQALHRDMELTVEPEPSLSSKSLESKIHSFLQGNPGFSAFNLGLSADPVLGGDNLSPLTGTDTQDGTPVRDEGGGTPTQDEVMDKPLMEPFTINTHQSSAVESAAKAAPAAYQNSTRQDPNNPQQHGHLQPGVAQNGQGYQPYSYSNQETLKHGIATPVAQYQQISGQRAGPGPREGAPGNASSNKIGEGFPGVSEGGWYGGTYPEGSTQHPRSYSMAKPGGVGENKTSGLYPYQAARTQEAQGLASQQGATTSSGFFKGILPPVPQLPPPPDGFDATPSMANSKMVAPEQKPMQNPEREEVTGAGVESVIGGMVIHDHQHKSMFHRDDPPYNPDDVHHHPVDLHHHPDDLHYQLKPYPEDHHHNALFHQDNPHHHPEDPYYRPGSPPHGYPRVRGRLTPPLSPSEGAYYNHDYQPHSLSPPHYGPRRPPPPHPEIHHPGLRPPHRPLRPVHHPVHHPHPRGPPRGPPHGPPRGPPRGPQFHPFRGPDPWLRGKCPGPRGGGPAGPVFLPKRPYLPPRF